MLRFLHRSAVLHLMATFFTATAGGLRGDETAAKGANADTGAVSSGPARPLASATPAARPSFAPRIDFNSIDLEPIDVEPLSEPIEAPPLDVFAGRTVRSMADGYGIIAVRGSTVPKVGQPAPRFELRSADGRQTIRLADYFGKKPLVLVFGSLT